MQLVISGRHTQLRASEKNMITEKLNKYEKKIPGLTKAEVVVNVEGDRHDIEVILHIAHNNPIVAHTSSSSVPAAIDFSIAKLDNLVSKFLGKKNNHHKTQKQPIENI